MGAPRQPEEHRPLVQHRRLLAAGVFFAPVSLDDRLAGRRIEDEYAAGGGKVILVEVEHVQN